MMKRVSVFALLLPGAASVKPSLSYAGGYYVSRELTTDGESSGSEYLGADGRWSSSAHHYPTHEAAEAALAGTKGAAVPETIAAQ